MGYLLAVLLSIATPARADQTTSRLGGLVAPTIGSLGWGTKLNNDIFQLSTKAASQYDTNTFYSSNTFTLPTLFNNLVGLGTILNLAEFTVMSSTGATQPVVYVSSQNGTTALFEVLGNGNASFAGTVTATINGQATTALALASAGTSAGSGYLALGVDASGNAKTAFVNTTTGGVSTSSEPWSAGAAFTTLALYAQLTGATFTGASGITNAAFTATGANGNFISASSMTTSGTVFGSQGNFSRSLIAGTTAIAPNYVLVSTGLPVLFSPMSTTEAGNLTGLGPGALIFNTTKGQYGYYEKTAGTLVYFSTYTSAGGGGDVTQAGNNSFTGNNVFQIPISTSAQASPSGTFTTQLGSGGSGQCVTGSTATITIPTGSAGNVKLWFSGAISPSVGLGNSIAYDFIVNGQFVDGADQQINNSANCFADSIGTNDTVGTNCQLKLYGQAAGSLSVCIVGFCGGSGTCTVRSGSGFVKSHDGIDLLP